MAANEIYSNSDKLIVRERVFNFLTTRSLPCRRETRVFIRFYSEHMKHDSHGDGDGISADGMFVIASFSYSSTFEFNFENYWNKTNMIRRSNSSYRLML